MNHNEYKKLIMLSIYSELNAGEKETIKEHLAHCDECRSELEKQKNILALISSPKTANVDDNLLLEARSQLRGAIRNEKSHKSFSSSIGDLLANLISPGFRLALSGITLILIGFVSGYLIFHSTSIDQVNPQNVQPDFASLLQDDVRISNINFTDPDPSDGEIEFTFNAIKPVKMRGKINDPQIQSILTYSMLYEKNPGVRLNSINAMDSEINMQFDNDVRDALVAVILTDSNPGVRYEAIKLVRKLPFDNEIKQAYLTVLKTDSSSSLKIEAIDALIEASKTGWLLDKPEIDLFKQKLQTDDNSYIRYRSKTILQEYN